jgi:hypothetical protein
LQKKFKHTRGRRPCLKRSPSNNGMRVRGRST